MEQEKLNRALMYFADGVETGYSSIITFAYKEFLNASERQELAKFLRSLTNTQSQVNQSHSRINVLQDSD